MPTYQVIGSGRDTGRSRKRTYHARDEQDVRQKAEADGTVVTELVELPPEPPTERQLDYAKELEITIPTGVTGEELSELISRHTWRDKPAAPELKVLAASYGVGFTKYVGKKLLFDRIFQQLIAPGREQDLAAWFSYRVYRELMNGEHGVKITSPDDEKIQKVAAQLATDSSVIQSIRKYRGEDLIWFGQWTSPGGMIQEGGSNRTIAYKRTAALIRRIVEAERYAERIENVKRYNERPAPPRLPVADSEKKGCMPVLLVGIGVVIALTAGISSLI